MWQCFIILSWDWQKINSDVMICTLCWQLLGNILSWHGLVGTQLLQRLALDGLLNRYIVLGLANSHVNRHSMEKCQAVSLLLFSLKSRGLFMQVKTFGSGTLCFIYTWLSQNTDVSHCHHTNFTLTHSLTPFVLYKQKLVLHIHTIYFIHTFILHFIRLFISVTVSSKTNKFYV